MTINFDYNDKTDPDWFKKRLENAKKLREMGKSPWKASDLFGCVDAELFGKLEKINEV